MAGQGVLHNVRVLDFAWWLAGPMVGKCLTQYGAEVIRVETEAYPDLAIVSKFRRSANDARGVG